MNQISRRVFLQRGSLLALPVSCGFAADERPDPYADARLVAGGPPALTPGSFTLAVLPDTQNYSQAFPATFAAQTEWIVRNKASYNILGVLHLGDITNKNTPEQWENAVAAMRTLDGQVPVFMVPGNHDYGENGGMQDRTSDFTKYFPAERFRSQAGFGGFYDMEPDRVENAWHLFSAGGRDFLVLCLEFGPRRDVVRWANEVVSRHSGREVILVTHAFTYYDDSRYDWKRHGTGQTWNPHSYPVARAAGDDVCDGEELWQQLICQHGNFILTINGHVLNDGLGHLASSTPDGRTVHQMLVNFQMRPQGGDGWLRLLEFRPDRTLQTCDYSPTRKQRNESAANRFSVRLSALG